MRSQFQFERRIEVKKIIFSLISVFLALFLVSCISRGPATGTGAEIATNANPETKATGEEEPAFGTRQNPVPLGTAVKVGSDWNITVLEVVPDAWSIIEEENMFNEPPEEGNQYVMVKIRFEYAGNDSGTPWTDLTQKYVASDGNSYSQGGAGVIPNDYFEIGEQFPGASAEGNICFVVPSDTLAGGTIIIEESFSFTETRVFFEGAK